MARCCGESEARAFSTASNSSRANSLRSAEGPVPGIAAARHFLVSLFHQSSNPTSFFQNEVLRFLA